MANSFTRAFVKPVRKRIRPLLLANSCSMNLSNGSFTSYFEYMRRCNWLHTRYGFMPDEAKRLGLLQSKNSNYESFVSKKKMLQQQRILNPSSFMEMTEDKAIFSIYCKNNNIPVPDLLGLFFKHSSGINWSEGTPLQDKSQWVNFFNNVCPDEFVIKPARGVYGHDILFVSKNDHAYTPESLYLHLTTSRYDSFVVQTVLENHSEILALSPKKGLQTVRVVTYVDEHAKVKTVFAFFKIIVGNNRIDNHEKGKLGNLLAELDLVSGRLKKPLLMTENGFKEVPNHPDTGRTLEGATLPEYRGISELAGQAALHFLPMRSIGWDIALTPDGPYIVEGNARWDPPLLGSFGIKDLQVFGNLSLLHQD